MVAAIESGQTATLSCSHSINGYDQILWYKQQHIDKKLEFLGYIRVQNPKKKQLLKWMGVLIKTKPPR